MSKEIRDLINAIKGNQIDNKPAIEPIVEVEKVAEKPAKKEVKAKVTQSTEPKVARKEKASTQPKAQAIQAEVEQTPQNAKSAFSEEFFASLMTKEFSFEQKSVSNIDDRVYEIFMLIKRKKRVKNIAVIINTILNDYIEENKEQIKKLLLDNKL